MINLKTHFSSIKSILCLDGEIPAHIFFKRHTNLPLLATDGAGATLIRQNIIPNIIVGDFDVIDQSVIPNNVEKIHITEQVTTDFEKALSVIATRNLFPCLVYGATGKESDHTLYNFLAAAKNSQNGSIIMHDSAFKAKEKYCIFVENQLAAELPLHANISLFAFTPTVVSSNGLTWELDNFALTPTNTSARNRVNAASINITVHSGQALVCFDVN